ncbi:carbohydrate ABC transporter permease [Fusibacter bizertensis]|uniref:Carbohydrate ABC transporter permease n=1 Tax=Fusibacter bizertensis TaxID=1488331 RepID=A0ABT6NG13_9FIRM|nr:carbohydrate ABC transporter permease [Fusibacter bizertensis]MDH8679346.1 carbohydrate ABC transporter permease [Fusibacter bizertensis]
MIKPIMKKTIKLLINMLIIVIFFVPFYWMILTAFKTLEETVQFPPSFWVSHPQWENFLVALKAIPFMKFTINSVVVSISVMLLQFLTVIPAAYAFARLKFKGKSLLFGTVLSTMMVPSQLVFLPIYLMFSKWGLINNYLSLILPFATSAFGIFMLRQSFMQVPEEILEAAKLDKASEFKTLTRIMLPAAKPTLVMLGLFSWISTWNDYFWPLVITTNDAVRTLPIGISSLRMVESGVTYHIVMAGNVLLIIPIIIVFLIAQKQIIRAFTYTGEK